MSWARWAGCVGGVVLAAASWGAGALPRPNSRVLWPGVAPGGRRRVAPRCSPRCRVLAMAVLVLAWWRLRDAGVSVRWWWVTIALWFAPLVAAMPLYSRDLYSYAAQGLLWDQGLAPTTTSSASSTRRGGGRRRPRGSTARRPTAPCGCCWPGPSPRSPASCGSPSCSFGCSPSSASSSWRGPCPTWPAGSAGRPCGPSGWGSRCRSSAPTSSGERTTTRSWSARSSAVSPWPCAGGSPSRASSSRSEPWSRSRPSSPCRSSRSSGPATPRRRGRRGRTGRHTPAGVRWCGPGR